MSNLQQLPPDLAQRLRDAQAVIDKASNYTRLVMTLGYGGFFAAWAGAKQYLSPKHVVLSGLLLMVSAFLFIAFQVLEAAFASHLYLGWARLTNADEKTRPARIEQLEKAQRRVNLGTARLWPPIFYSCVVTGFAGVFILMWGFARSLRALW